MFLEETVVSTESEFRLLVVGVGLSRVYAAVAAAALRGKIDELAITDIEEMILHNLQSTTLGLKSEITFASAIPRALESLRLTLATAAQARDPRK